MRVWDIPVQQLCRKHLMAQHYEIHTIYTVITDSRKGYSKHPEVIRWISNIPALVDIHNKTANEMICRGYNHRSPLPQYAVFGPQTSLVNTIEEQINILHNKGCECMR